MAVWWLRVLIVICLVIFAVVSFFYFRQHSMLYHPRPYDAGYATALPRDGVELNFTTLAGKQTAFYLPRDTARQLPRRIWVAFCGNGSLALDWVQLVEQDRHPGDAFLLIDYPGCGKSQGYATIETTRAVADKALDALTIHLGVRKDQLESRLNVIGHSWGTAVGLDFATRHAVQRVVLIASSQLCGKKPAPWSENFFPICSSKTMIIAGHCENCHVVRLRRAWRFFTAPRTKIFPSE